MKTPSASSDRIDSNFNKSVAKGFGVDRETIRSDRPTGVHSRPWNLTPTLFRSFASVYGSSARSCDRPTVLKGLPAAPGGKGCLPASERSRQKACAGQACARRGERRKSALRKGAFAGGSDGLRPDFRAGIASSTTLASHDSGQQESHVIGGSQGRYARSGKPERASQKRTLPSSGPPRCASPRQPND